MKKGLLVVSLASLLLTGCAINQSVKPVETIAGRDICVVFNPTVSQAGFLTAYMRSLNEKGYSVRQLPSGASITECVMTSTYTANWRWDLALYMAFADIRVYNNGRQVGQAVYDATQGGGNMNKFIKGEEKIAELVDLLFPGRAPAATTSPTAAATAVASPAPPTGATAGRDEAVRLLKLNELRDKGLISPEEYDKKRKEILDRL